MQFARRVLPAIKTVAIQLAVFAALLGVLEGVARYAEPSLKRPALELELYPVPYMMWAGRAGATDQIWPNIITNEPVHARIKFNNWGFIEDTDFSTVPTADYVRQYGKKPGERLVLISGGSVVHGAGATANDKTIAAQMMRHLNEHSSGPRYRVINMGIGGWIAYQQFIALSLFGLPLNPDWVINMDGHNDGAAPCSHGSGAGNPLLWPRFLYFLNGGSLQQTNPVLQDIARRSALFRIVSGIEGEPKNAMARGIVVDDRDPDKRFLFKHEGLTVALQDPQVDFYVQAQRNVLALFSRANVIMSSQPYMYGNGVTRAYLTAFGPEGTEATRATLRAELDRYMAENGTKACDTRANSQHLGYFMGRSAFRLERLAAEEQAADPSRKVIYLNTESVFPFDLKLRGRYFVDNAHMSDQGQDRLGEFFAQAILSAERGARFDYAAFVKDGADRATGGN